MIQVYTGDGKGKTTAALGLALRAAGYGSKVVLVQLLKGADSGEVLMLADQPRFTFLRNSREYGDEKGLSKEDIADMIREHNQNLQLALNFCRKNLCDVLVLDELTVAWNWNFVDKDLVKEILAENWHGKELIITGREAPDSFVQQADYVSEINKIKHPADRGMLPREGIEY